MGLIRYLSSHVILTGTTDYLEVGTEPVYEYSSGLQDGAPMRARAAKLMMTHAANCRRKSFMLRSVTVPLNFISYYIKI